MSVRRGFPVTVLVTVSLVGASGLACTAARQRATPAASDTPVKVVILSRHGVRSPIPNQSELDTWTASKWPAWYCGAGPDYMKACEPGQLTPRGRTLAEQMGRYYQNALAGLLPTDKCPAQDDVFFWADLTERTENTGLALLRGFRPSCDIDQHFHTASTKTDRIFHPVGGGRCALSVPAVRQIALGDPGPNCLLSVLMTQVSVRVVVFQEGDWVCAQCLGHDIAAQAKTLEDCLYELERLIVGHIAISIENRLDPLHDLKPAPRRFWEWFERSKIPLTAKRFQFTAGDLDRHGLVVEPPQIRTNLKRPDHCRRHSPGYRRWENSFRTLAAMASPSAALASTFAARVV
jgi:predicted RNase H-like HicB family nuclease